MAKSQSSVEFSLVISLVILGFTVFLIFLNERFDEMETQKSYNVLEDLGTVVKSEVELATLAESGYRRNFSLPSTVARRDFEIEYRNGTTLKANYSIFSVKYKESDISHYVFIMPPNITGDFEEGDNVIKKVNDTVVVN